VVSFLKAGRLAQGPAVRLTDRRHPPRLDVLTMTRSAYVQVRCTVVGAVERARLTLRRATTDLRAPNLTRSYRLRRTKPSRSRPHRDLPTGHPRAAAGRDRRRPPRRRAPVPDPRPRRGGGAHRHQTSPGPPAAADAPPAARRHHDPARGHGLLPLARRTHRHPRRPGPAGRVRRRAAPQRARRPHHLGLTWHPADGLHLRIRTSKTDQDAAGATIVLPYGRHPRTCPPCAALRWLRLLDAAAHGRPAVMRAVLETPPRSEQGHLHPHPDNPAPGSDNQGAGRAGARAADPSAGPRRPRRARPAGRCGSSSSDCDWTRLRWGRTLGRWHTQPAPT